MSTDLPRLTTKELSEWRARAVALKGKRCWACNLPLLGVVHADHDHKTGRIRGAVHASCNAQIGCYERGALRYGAPPERSRALAHGLGKYLYKEHEPLIYPTHRSPAEKATLYKKRAAVRRKKAQQEASK